VFLLVKPIERWRIVAAKLAVAAGMTVGLVALVTLVTGLIVVAGRGGEEIVVAFTIAVAIGGVLYSALFVALSVVTGRALILGLAYILIWEGLLAGLLEGTQVLSIRQYTLAIARLLAGGDGQAIAVTLAGSVALVLSVVVFALSFVVASRRLASYEVSGTD
jgi:ABC-2 type transport system permease protein